MLVHGSWHGAWCWGLVEPELNQAGHISLAIDLPGHGLDAVIPDSFRSRPLDPSAFGTEPSAIAGIGIDSFADAVIAAADRVRAMGADRVVAVGHSMGGVPITFAAAKSPEKFASLVYIAALLPTPGKPAGFYTTLEDQTARSKIGGLIAADPAVIGALRFDPRTEDSAMLTAGKEALAADVDDALWTTAMHMFTPDAPAAMYGQMADFTQGFGALEKNVHPVHAGLHLDRHDLRGNCRGFEPGVAFQSDGTRGHRVFPRGDVLQAGRTGEPSHRGSLTGVRQPRLVPLPSRSERADGCR